MALTVLLHASSLAAGNESHLLRLRRSVQQDTNGTSARIVFDFRGERPVRFNSENPDKFVITFKKLTSKIDPEVVIGEKFSPVSSVRVINEAAGSEIWVLYRSPNCLAKPDVLPAESGKPDEYRIILTVSGSKIQPQVDNTGVKAPAKAPQEGASSDLADSIKSAEQLLSKKRYQEANDLFKRISTQNPQKREDLVSVLYGLADSFYLLHEQQLESVALKVITLYQNAIKADPDSPLSAWANYRMALCYQVLGDSAKAREHFESVVKRFPQHPATPQAWIALGFIYRQSGSHQEAAKAFSSALQFPLENRQRTEALCLLGESCYILGNSPQAVKALEQAFKQDPSVVYQQPLLVRYLGEVYFLERDYEKSRHYLLWYYNLSPNAEAQDLVLAKIAETYLMQDQTGLANRLYDFIRSTFPDTDGDIVAQIRKADFQSSKGNLSPDEDIALYRDLLEKPRSPSLISLIYRKYITKLIEHQQFNTALQVIDEALSKDIDKAAKEDFLKLRSQLIVQWAEHAFQKRDYARVIQLYQDHTDDFKKASTIEHLYMAADSYSELKLPFQALNLYQEIKAKNREPDEHLLMKMARCALAIGDSEKSITLCNQITSSSLLQEKLQLLMHIYYSRHQFAKVIEIVDNSRESLDEESRRIMAPVIGESLVQLGQMEKALPWIQNALNETPDLKRDADRIAHLYVLEAACHDHLGEREKVIESIEKAVAVAQSEELKSQLRYDLAKMYYETGKTEKAMEILNILVSSPLSFWQTAAKQQLDYIQMKTR